MEWTRWVAKCGKLRASVSSRLTRFSKSPTTHSLQARAARRKVLWTGGQRSRFVPCNKCSVIGGIARGCARDWRRHGYLRVRKNAESGIMRRILTNQNDNIIIS